MATDRACRAALASAVAEVERLGGCVDEECQHADCWLGGLTGEVRRHVDEAVLFVLDKSIGLAADSTSRTEAADG